MKFSLISARTLLQPQDRGPERSPHAKTATTAIEKVNRYCAQKSEQMCVSAIAHLSGRIGVVMKAVNLITGETPCVAATAASNPARASSVLIAR